MARGYPAGCGLFGARSAVVRRNQRLVWFSYLAADDLREACASGTVDRIRYVFNADFNREVRTIDIAAQRLVAQRFRGSTWLQVQSMSLLNRPQTAEKTMNDNELGAILAAIDRGQARAVTLPSNEHYAVLETCIAGAFQVRGYNGRDLESNKLFELMAGLDPLDERWPRLDPSRRPPPPYAVVRDDQMPFFVVRISAGGVRN